MPDSNHNRSTAILNVLFGSVGYIVLRFILKLTRVKVLSSLLMPAQYGTITIVTVTISAITMVSSLGSIEFMMRHLPGRDEKYQYGILKRITGTFGSLACLLALVGAVVLMIARPVKLDLSTSGVIGAAVLLVLMALVNQRVYFLLAQGRYSVMRVFQLAYSDAWFIGLTYLALCPLILSWTTATAIWTWAAWIGVILIASFRFMPLKKQLHAHAEKGTLRQIVAFGTPLLPMILGEWLFKIIDQWVVLWATDAATVAIYAIAVNIAMVGFVVGTPILDILITEFNKRRNSVPDLDRDSLHKDEVLGSLLTMMIRHTAALSIPIMAALCVMGAPLVLLISNARFIDAVEIMPWASLLPWLFMTNLVLARVMLATDRSRFVGGTYLVAAILALVLDIVLVPRLGARGAAIGNSIALGTIVAAIGSKLRLWRWVTMRGVMPFRLAALALVSFGWLSFVSNSLSGLGSLAKLGAGGLVCAAAIVGLGLISWSDLRMIVGSATKPGVDDMADEAKPDADDTGEANMPLVSVVVVGYGKPEYTIDCIESVKKSDYPNTSIVFVDNGSEEADFEAVCAAVSDVTVLRFVENVGVGNGFNGGMAHAIGAGADYVIMLNNDTTIDPGMVSRMVATAKLSADIGVVVPKVFYDEKPDVIWSAGSRFRRFPPAIVHRNMTGPDDGRFDKDTELEFSCFCAAMLTSPMLKDIGLLDPVYHVFQEDYDLCARAMKAGYRAVLSPDAHMWHKIVPSPRQRRKRTPQYWEIHGRGHALFRRKHSDLKLLTGRMHRVYIFLRVLAEGHLVGVKYYLRGLKTGSTVDLESEPRWDSLKTVPEVNRD